MVIRLRARGLSGVRRGGSGTGWGLKGVCVEQAVRGSPSSLTTGPLRDSMCLLLILVLHKSRARQRSVWNRNSTEQVYPDVVRSWGEEGRGGWEDTGPMWQASLHLLSFLNLHQRKELLQGGGGGGTSGCCAVCHFETLFKIWENLL